VRVRVASGVAFFIVREARSSSFVVVRVACGCGVVDGVGRGVVRDASSCGSKGVIARDDVGQKGITRREPRRRRRLARRW
jgi:hypothetical protein